MVFASECVEVSVDYLTKVLNNIFRVGNVHLRR
jgi:hypothetical protein